MTSTDAMDPEYRQILARQADLFLPFESGDIPAVRENRTRVLGSPAGRLNDRVRSLSDGSAMKFVPGQERVGQILYAHGGGWVLCNRTTHAAIMTDLAVVSDMPVIGPDYPLAPEAQYPVALDELCDHALRLAKTRPDVPLVLAGDSAGANLALATAARLRDEGEVRVDALVLFYGCYRCQFDSDSHRQMGDGRFGLSTVLMRRYWSLYLGDHPDPVYGDLSGLDVRGLPPVFIGDAALDCLVDDGAWLAGVLQAAGVDYVRKVVPGVPHGFLHHTGSFDPAFHLLSYAGEWLKSRFH